MPLIIYHKTPYRLLLLILLFSTVNGYAASPGWYAGVGFGQSTLEPDDSGTPFIQEDNKSSGLKLHLGYKWKNRISIESFYADLGKAGFEDGRELEYSTYGLAAGYSYPVIPEFASIYLKTGVSKLLNKGSVPFRQENDVSVLLGGGIEIELRDGFSLNLGYESYHEDAELVFISFNKNFGFPKPALVKVKVTAPYLELYTGPGEGYPKFYAVERDDTVTILKSKTDWYKVRTNRDKEGWVTREQLEQTLLVPSDTPLEFGKSAGDDYPGRRWEIGILGGDFGGADMLTVYAAYNLTENLSAELALSQAAGSFSDSFLADVNLNYMFMPDWRVTPFFKLGTGIIRTDPKSTLIQTEDRTDETAHVGGGISAYITRRFVFRAEYNSYVVFTSRDDNEDIDEWKLGFGFFF